MWILIALNERALFLQKKHLKQAIYYIRGLKIQSFSSIKYLN